MKTILLIIAIVFSGVLIHAQELNENAKFLKNTTNETLKATYKDIKEAAVKEWVDDHQMIVYTINKQCNGYSEMTEAMDKSNYDEDVMLKALAEWGQLTDDNRIKADWVMVMYEYKKQLKAKSAY